MAVATFLCKGYSESKLGEVSQGGLEHIEGVVKVMFAWAKPILATNLWQTSEQELQGLLQLVLLLLCKQRQELLTCHDRVLGGQE